MNPKYLLGFILVWSTMWRFYWLKEPMRPDETLSFLFFARLPLPDIAHTYTIPNNHIFHSILMHISWKLFGVSEWSLRLPAFLAGIFSLGAVAYAAKIISNRRVVIASVGLSCVSHALLFYGTNGRGYSLQVFLACLLMGLVFSGAPWRTAAPLVFFSALFSFLMVWTVPTGVVFLVPFWAYLLFFPPDRIGAFHRRGAVLAIAFTVLSAAMAYFPIYHEMAQTAPLQLATSYPLSSFFCDVLKEASQGICPWLIFLLGLILGLVLLPAYVRGLLAAVLFGYPLLVVIASAFHWDIRFYVRSYCVLYPFAYMAFAAGILLLPERLGWKPFGRRVFYVAVGCALAIFGLRDTEKIFADRSLLFYPDRNIRGEVRDLVRGFASTLRPGDRINGTTALDNVAAFYTVEQKGFNGFYGIRHLYSQNISRLFILGPEAEVIKFRAETLDPRLWSSPKPVTKVNSLGIYELSRLNTGQPLPTRIQGYTD